MRTMIKNIINSTLYRIIFIIILGQLLYFFWVTKPEIAYNYEYLQQSHREMNLLPDSTQANYSEVKKPQIIILYYTYTTDKKWVEILDFYLKEAEKNAWKWNNIIEEIGENNNGRALTFYKNNFSLSLGCADIQLKKLTYILIFTWDPQVSSPNQL